MASELLYVSDGDIVTASRQNDITDSIGKGLYKVNTQRIEVRDVPVVDYFRNWVGNPIPVASGGTGESTANGALNVLLPSQSSNNGKFLATDGSNTFWVNENVTGDRKLMVSSFDNYPDYLVSKVIAGTGINIIKGNPGSSEFLSIVNTSPDQVVNLVSGSNISIIGSYPNFTISSLAASSFLSLSDTPSSYNGFSTKVLAVNNDESGIEFITVSTVDEKLKVSSNDINSGYLFDKVLASSGIGLLINSLSGDEKLSILNTDRGSVAVVSHESIYNHSSFITNLSSFTTDNLSEGSTNKYDVPITLTEGSNISISGTYPSFTITSTASVSDEKVKIDANDLVAGYLEDKLVAGSGISVTKGTGDGEGTLIVANTDKGSDVDLSGKENVGVAASLDSQHLLDFTHGDIAHANRSSLDLVSGTNTGDQDLSGYQLTSAKGQNNGYASLDSGGKIPATELPSTVMEFKGNWNALTNTPTLVDGTGDAGDVYLVSVAGTQDLGSGDITFALGDWVLYNGTIWEKSINSNAVVSVNGQQGVVSLTTDNVGEGATNKYDKTVSFTGGTNVTISETYPDFTITDNSINATDLSTALGSYVPYSGASTSVDLGANDLKAKNLISNHTIPKLSLINSVDGYNTNLKREGLISTLNAEVQTSGGVAQAFKGQGTGGAEIQNWTTQGTLSVSFWFKWSGTINESILVKRGRNQAGCPNIFWISSGMTARVSASGGSVPDTSVPAGWNHWLITFENNALGTLTALKIYLNGILTTSGNANNAMDTVTPDSLYYMLNVGAYPCNSSLQELLVTYDLLDGTDALAMYNSGLGRRENPTNYPNIFGLWAFNEGTGTLASDRSGNNNNFNLQGSYDWEEGVIVDAGAIEEHSFVTISDGVGPNEKGTVTLGGFSKNVVVDGSPVIISHNGTDKIKISNIGEVSVEDDLTADSFIKDGGVSTEFLKADGSVDSNTYLTTTSAGTIYVPYTGATTSVDLGNNNLTSNQVIVNSENPQVSLINSNTNRVSYLKRNELNNELVLQSEVYKPGGAGNAFYLSTKNTDYVNIPHHNSLNFDSEMSVSVWVYPTEQGTIVMKTSGSWEDGWGLAEFGINILFWVKTYTNSATSTVKTNLNQWNHLVGTFDGTTIKLYLNGVKRTDYVYASPTTVTNNLVQNLRITSADQFSMLGRVDELQLWNKVLSQSEVTALYNSGNGLLGTIDDNTVGLWHIDEISGTNVADSSINGNNGTIIGATASLGLGHIPFEGNYNLNTILSYSDGVKPGEGGIINFGKSDHSLNLLSRNLDVEGDLTVDTNTLFVDATNNRVGIGTNDISSIDAKLIVVGAENITDNTTTMRTISAGGIGYFGTVGLHPMYLRTNNTVRIRIGSDGKVAIGNNDATLAFDVFGSSFLRAGSGASSEFEQLRLGRSDLAIRYHSIYTSHGALDSDNYLQFRLHDKGGSPFTGQTTVMTLNGSGNVGIGTTTPGEKLEIDGNLFLNGDNDKIYLGADKDEYLEYDATLDGIQTAGIFKASEVRAIHKANDGTAPVADGTYTFYNDGVTSGQVTSMTIKDGVVTALGQIP